MHLISALASGISAAATGTCKLVKRGTASNANYYKDFEATQVYSAQPISLDSSGSAVLYVNELVDVLVYDLNGTLVREFVAGDSATAVEVISPSFTGVSYTDGSSGVSKPTTLESVLDLWVGSAGASDFKVIPSGTSTPLTIAAATATLAGLFFNVKTYGAIGNGSADDTTAINAAAAAATGTSTGGGTVFFPPGTYRATTSIAWPAGVKMLGGGGNASKLMFDYGGGQNLQVTTTEALTVWEGMYISAQTTPTTNAIVRILGSGRLSIFDCTVGGDAAAQGNCVQFAGVGAAVTLARSKFRGINNQPIIYMTAANLVRVVECEVVNIGTVGGDHILAASGLIVMGSRFSCDSVTSGTPIYIDYSASGTYGPPEVVGNYFADGVAVTPIAINNSLATPSSDVVEVGNTFGLGSLAGFGITRYAYTSAGYAPGTAGFYTGFHGSRMSECEVSTTPVTFVADAKTHGFSMVMISSGAALALSSNLGRVGDIWVLQVHNNSGGLLTVTPNASSVLLDALAATFTVANNTKRQLVFAFLPVLAGAGTGRWTQIATSTTA